MPIETVKDILEDLARNMHLPHDDDHTMVAISMENPFHCPRCFIDHFEPRLKSAMRAERALAIGHLILDEKAPQ